MKQLSPERLLILQSMESSVAYQVSELADILGLKVSLTQKQLSALLELGLVTKPGWGRYALADNWQSLIAELRPIPETAPQSVYLLRCGEYYKIGISNNVAQRVKDLQCASPHEIVYLCSIATANAPALESELHERYSAKHQRGEWFKLDIWDVEEIIDMSQTADDFNDTST